MIKDALRSFASAGSGRKKGERRLPGVKLDLANAYSAVFSGNASDVQKDMVLVDLANFSGFYRIAPEGSDLSRHEGRREVFGRIFAMTRMTADERAAFEREVRHQGFIDQFEGEIT